MVDQHDEILGKHEEKLDNIQQDLVDIKTRLGVKDLTNGQIVDYQKRLVDAQEREREERKEQDAFILSYLDKVDSRTWMILAGIIVIFLGELLPPSKAFRMGVAPSRVSLPDLARRSSQFPAVVMTLI